MNLESSITPIKKLTNKNQGDNNKKSQKIPSIKKEFMGTKEIKTHLFTKNINKTVKTPTIPVQQSIVNPLKIKSPLKDDKKIPLKSKNIKKKNISEEKQKKSLQDTTELKMIKNRLQTPKKSINKSLISSKPKEEISFLLKSTLDNTAKLPKTIKQKIISSKTPEKPIKLNLESHDNIQSTKIINKKIIPSKTPEKPITLNLESHDNIQSPKKINKKITPSKALEKPITLNLESHDNIQSQTKTAPWFDPWSAAEINKQNSLETTVNPIDNQKKTAMINEKIQKLSQKLMENKKENTKQEFNLSNDENHTNINHNHHHKNHENNRNNSINDNKKTTKKQQSNSSNDENHININHKENKKQESNSPKDENHKHINHNYHPQPHQNNRNNSVNDSKKYKKKSSITGTEFLYKSHKHNHEQPSEIINANNKINTLLIDTSIEGCTRLAKIYEENGKYKLITMIEELDNEENIQSNIYLATVSKIDKSNNSLFLQYDQNKTCFLNIKELIKQNIGEKEIDNIQNGDKFIIQMVRERKNHKYPKVTTNIMMYGLYCNIILDSQPDLFYQNQNINHLPIYNSLQQQKILQNIKIYLKQPPETINQKLLMDDIKYMIRTWKHIKSITAQKKEIGLLHFEPHIQRMIRSILDNQTEKIYLDDMNAMERIKSMPFLFNKQQSKNIFFHEGNLFQEYNIADEIHRIDKLSVIRDGIRLTFQKTEALTTVDVDYSSKNNKKSIKNLWDINREAAHLIIDEIVKKNIGGSVLIDFINMYMPNEQHNTFVQMIKNKFYDFSINCAVYNVKQLGFILLCLPYNKYDIFNRLYEKCHHCQGGIVMKMNYQLNGVVEIINNFIEEKKAFNKDDIYSDGNILFIKTHVYNNLVQYKNFIIYKLMENSIIPMIF